MRHFIIFYIVFFISTLYGQVGVSNGSVWVNPMDLHERTFWGNNNYPTTRNGDYGYSMYFFPDSNATVEVFGPAYIDPWLSSVAQTFDLNGGMCSLPNAPFDSNSNRFLKDAYFTIDSISIDYAYARFSPTNDIDTLIIAVYAKNNGNLTRFVQTIGGINKHALDYRNKGNGKNLPDSAIAEYKVLLNSSMAGGFFGRNLRIPANLDIYNSDGEFAIAVEYKPGRVHTKLSDTIAKNANVFRVAIAAPAGYSNYYPSLTNDKTAAGFNNINFCKYGTFNRFVHCASTTNCGYQVIGISPLIAKQIPVVCDTTYDTISINCSNQQFYTWNNQYLSSSGDFQYMDTSNNTGCDTLNYLSLTFSKITYDTIVTQECNEYISPSGDTILSTTSFSDTIPNSLGCDSVIYIDVTIVGSFYQVSQNLKGCDSLLIPRIGFVSNTVTLFDTVYSSISCDTIFTYNIEINKTKFDSIIIHACDSFLSPSGKMKYATENFSDTIQTHKGCDSIIYVELTVSFATYRSFNGSACISHILPSGKYIDTTGVYLDTILNSSGCDSIITFNMTIREIDTSFVLFPTSIRSNEIGGTYRWFNCDSSFKEVFGFSQYSRSLHPSVKGNYAIEVTKNGCKDTTRCGYVRNCDIDIARRYNSDGSASFYLLTADTTQIASYSWQIDNGFNVYYASSDTVTRFFEDNPHNHAQLTVTYMDGTTCYKVWNFIDFTHPNGCSFTADTLGLDTAGNLIMKFYINKVSPHDKVSLWVIGDSNNLGSYYRTYSNVDTIIDTLEFNKSYVEMNRYNPYSKNYCRSRQGFRKPNPVVLCNAKFSLVQTSPFQVLLLDSSFGSFRTDKQWYYGDGNYDSSVNFPSHLYSSVGNYEICLYLYDYDTIRNYMSCFSWFCDSIKIDASGILSRSSGGASSFTVNIIPHTSYFNRDTNSITSCESYTLTRGSIVVTTSGVYRDTLINSFGTDSIVILDITILPEKTTSQTLSVCSIYNSPSGKTYFQSGTYFDTLTSNNSCDSIITTYLTVLKDSVSIPISICDSMILSNGYVVKASGEYRDTLTNSFGCDSVLIYQVIKNSSSSVTVLNPNVCSQYISPKGNVLTTTGSYSDTLINIQGCDSIIKINLTIRKKTYSTHSLAGCDSIQSPSGKWFYVSGNYFDTIPNSDGCDSVISLSVTVSNSSFQTINVLDCDSATISSGVVVYTSGTYFDTLSTTNGCDSIIKTVAVINQSTSFSIFDTICYSYTSPSGSIWTTSGVYYDTIINASGCDSLLTVNLIINTDSYSTISDSICGIYTSPSGKIYYNSGNYSDTIKNTAGCDSIISISLIDKIDVQLNVSGITISSAETNSTFQWLDCNNGYSPIMGETSNSFVPLSNGKYAVEIIKSSCSDTSQCVDINSVGIDINNLEGYKCYPNPNSGNFIIELNSMIDELSVSIYSVNGKLVQENVFYKSNKINVNTELTSGVYFVLLNDGKSKQRVKIVVQ
ncbi:MAG: T9SS type A sorting domain-containing protein [Flavobacteriales bacterium]